MKRYGMAIRIKPEKIEEYKKLHAHMWPEIIAILQKHHIKNYSIYLKDHMLFGYLEYHGENYEEDMRQIGEYDIMKKWWEHTAPCQTPLPLRREHEWWALMEEVFHMD